MMGPLGEQILVKLCKGLQQNDLKLKCSILRAFALANVDSPSIDFVLEVLLKAAKEPQSAEARKAALVSLDILRKKATEDCGSAEPQIPYLRARSLLPFFYSSLSDKSQQVRNSALLAIQNFGPQGELLFIEGVTKEENTKVKEHCC